MISPWCDNYKKQSLQLRISSHWLCFILYGAEVLQQMDAVFAGADSDILRPQGRLYFADVSLP